MSSNIFRIIKLISGVILLIINILIWINGLFINRGSGGEIILAVPLLVAGAFLLLGWYKGKGLSGPRPSKQMQWKFILGVLLINYGILYLIYVVQDVIYSDAIDFLSLPGIILPFLLGLFIMGFILSWSHELYAGFFFLVWYGLAVFATFNYFEISNRGPHILFGIAILVQGILYINYHFKIKSG